MIKKAIVVPIIIGGVMIVLGGTIAGISAAAAGGFAALSTAEPYVARIIEVPADLNINVEEENNKIVINSSETATNVSITVYENEYEAYISTSDETNFNLNYQNNTPWVKRIFYFPTSLRTMTITVPDNYVASLNIITSNAVIDTNNISLQGELSLESVNGVIDIDDVNVIGSIAVRTTNSKIEINDTTSQTNISASSINGYIGLNNLEGVDIIAQTSNGKIAADNILSSHKMSLKTTNGQITTDDIDVASEIRLETTNGEIRGNVKGPSSDYDVDSQTTNGSNNLLSYNSQTPTTGDKLLYVRSYNGVINITFK
ncbi:MAG: DUF4097 family beta strand repeat-containing protein [Bacilli bacterium]